MAKPARTSSPATSGADDQRGRKMRAVLAACRRLGLDQDDRKALQAELTGTASMADMSVRQLNTLLDQLNKGWKPAAAHRPHVGKIRALWWTLYWIGGVDEPNEKALTAFVKRQSGVASLKFLGHQDAPSVIEALKDWAARIGVVWPLQADIDRDAEVFPGYDRAAADRHAVIWYLTCQLVHAGVLMGNSEAYLAKALKLTGSRHSWTIRELDDAIRLLGRKWREVK